MIWPFSIITELRRDLDYANSEIKDLNKKHWNVMGELAMVYRYLGVDKVKQPERVYLAKKGGPENSIRKGTGDE